VGVKAPGNAKATTFLPGAKSSSVVTAFGPSGPSVRSVALGTLSPTFAIICSFNCRPDGRTHEPPDPRSGVAFCRIQEHIGRGAGLIFARTIPMDLEDDIRMPGSGSPSASLVGRFLVAAPSMPDERFQKSVVFICKHDDDGALGIIVNNKVEDLPLGQVY